MDDQTRRLTEDTRDMTAAELARARAYDTSLTSRWTDAGLEQREQRQRLTLHTRRHTPAELAGQPEPGLKTIGMLLAHIACAETHLVQGGLLGEKIGHAKDVIGIAEEQEGMPLAPGARRSPALEG